MAVDVPLVTTKPASAGYTGGVQRHEQTMTLDSKLWAHVGGRPWGVTVSDNLDCGSPTRGKLCGAVDALPSVSPPGR